MPALSAPGRTERSRVAGRNLALITIILIFVTMFASHLISSL
jgi:hypothetical protein